MAAAGSNLLVACCDGRLELWKQANSLDVHCETVSAPSARHDCGESPSLWGVCSLPLCMLLQPLQSSPQLPESFDTAKTETAASERRKSTCVSLPDWLELPSEIVCRRVFPFLALCDLACHIAVLSRAHRGAVQNELRSTDRTEHVGICFSDGTAWLLNDKLRVLARRDLPFCAAYATSAVLLPDGGCNDKRQAAVLIAPKTDLVASSRYATVVMPHLRKIACSSSGGLKQPDMVVERLDLIAADAPLAAAILDPSLPQEAALERSTSPRDTVRAQVMAPSTSLAAYDPAHTLSVAVSEDQLWTLLANAEVLMLAASSTRLNDGSSDRQAAA
eukprot:TRINITY_DN38422_c0_g2_i1.p1 TRINITY_DN38422_c0_g2~~TRINITY_DN38422_c0_g2_i1.p1  ORF type:complete len:332 (+),score=63.08 TRINITY_DN38422_c0_g2_i1:1163-2158(+)